ncbi:valine--tRNA ligase [Candidatus Woesearchaeota archaeon]|nr:valine--tRNA ligase [Candidatus Woesearchaeota archaeon]|tara:strand:+ start:20060 stop:22441 length:2382 start_codon:yes stop_codon:yes gene_type:complete
MESKLKEKRWKKEVEEAIYSEWKEKAFYKFDEKSKKPVYSIDTPPPYLNTPIHIGHATTYTLMDMFARFKRMKGFNVLFPLGLDKNGLPIEVAAEKKFGIKFNKMPRIEFLKKCKQVLDEAGMASTTSFLRLGIGFNSWKLGTEIGEVYETDSPDYRALTQETFIELWNKELIYEEERINNYCPGCRTTIADAEIEYVDLPTKFNYVKFKVKETGKEITIGTTRPELIASCGAVIFHPDDKRYKDLNNKTIITPIYSKKVKIFAHPSASIEKGTGLVMMCSAGDTVDIRFFREMKLKPVISINQDGTMNKNAGFLEGLKVKDAREKIIEELESKNLLEKQTPVTHRTPVCDRSGDAVEFISMKEFYLKQVEFKNEMLKLAKQSNFHDESSRQMLIDWIQTISMDWPISRRRYYATEIPLWYCKKCSKAVAPKEIKYYQPWREPAPIKKCSCGSKEFTGETRVLDTWFDSANSPLYVLKYKRNDKFFKKSFPCTLRPQGKDIVRTWLYYTFLKGYLLTGKCVFNDVWINYYVVDEHGKKMSKRKGNVVDPKEILDKYGAEPFRLWCAVEGNITTSDFRCSFDRIEGAGKTIIKLWNVARFISMFPEAKSAKPTELDKWILKELNDLVKTANENYENYNFHKPATLIRHFIWETFASHYLELVKNRAYNEDKNFTKQEQDAALNTLHTCLHTVLKLLAPITPMVTYKIYKDLTKKDIHFEDFPKAEKVPATKINTQQLIELNSAIWKAKKDQGLSLKADISKVVIPEQLKPIEKDLQTTHHIKNISYGKKMEVKV